MGKREIVIPERPFRLIESKRDLDPFTDQIVIGLPAGQGGNLE
jgi:hypothetical protein